MKRCAFLTHEALPGGTADDRLAAARLESAGWRVEAIPWSAAGVDWTSYDAVVVRSTWDYHRRTTEFLNRLREIDRAGARLFNPLAVISWNVSKTYLRDLEALGVPTVPTVFRHGLGAGALRRISAELNVADLVVKPVVSASAEGVARVTRRSTAVHRSAIESAFGERPVMAQPVVQAVLREGEYSLVYLDGAYSHAVQKRPKRGDFRVQEEHGGSSRRVEPERSLVAVGDSAMAALPEVPLYARVDVVRSNDAKGWWLMELELIEPALYLAVEPAAPERFAAALDRRVRANSVARAGGRGNQTQ